MTVHWKGDLGGSDLGVFGDVLQLLLQRGSGSAFLLPVLVSLAVCTCNCVTSILCLD